MLRCGERGGHRAENNGGGERGSDELFHFQSPGKCEGLDWSSMTGTTLVALFLAGRQREVDRFLNGLFRFLDGMLRCGERGGHRAENNGGGERGSDELFHF